MKRASVLTLMALLGASALPAAPSHAAFPGTNGKIVFFVSGRRPIDPGDMYVMNADGTRRRQLTDPGSYESHAGWSASGRLIVFERRTEAYPNTPHRWVWTVRANGRRPTRIGRKNRGEPSISPDGTQIAYVKGIFSSADLYIMDMTGAVVRRLTSTFGEESGPAWSPDGSTIAFLMDDPVSGETEIWTIPAEGGEPTQVTSNGIGIGDIEWSPDGTLLAYTTTVSPPQIGVVDADAGNDHLILAEARRGNAHPAWSPDGTLVAFARFIPSVGNWDIWTMAPDGSDLIQLTDRSRNETDPDWQASPTA